MTTPPNLPPNIQKLVATKEKWAETKRAIVGGQPETANRLPPGQRLVKEWPVLDLGIHPTVSTAEWSLTVGGAVAHPIRWTFDDLMAQEQIDTVSDIHCVTTWSCYDYAWRGVRFTTLLDLVQPAAEATHVMFRGADDYTVNVPLDYLARPDSLIATHCQGQPLSKEHGGPVRGLIPVLYLWKSAKWMVEMTFLTKDAPGFWEQRGYHDIGDPWKEERYR